MIETSHPTRRSSIRLFLKYFSIVLGSDMSFGSTGSIIFNEFTVDSLTGRPSGGLFG